MANTLINPLYPRPHIPAGSTSVASGVMLTISSSSAATSFLATQFNPLSPPELIVLDIQSNTVAVTFDGATPLAGTSGHLLAAGQNYTWQLGTLLMAKFALQGSTSAQIYASSFSM